MCSFGAFRFEFGLCCFIIVLHDVILFHLVAPFLIVTCNWRIEGWNYNILEVDPKLECIFKVWDFIRIEVGPIGFEKERGQIIFSTVGRIQIFSKPVERTSRIQVWLRPVLYYTVPSLVWISYLIECVLLIFIITNSFSSMAIKCYWIGT